MAADLRIDEKIYHSLHCEKCSGWLRLTIKGLSTTIEGIGINAEDIRILICALCSQEYFPPPTKQILRSFVDQAKARGATVVRISRKNNLPQKRFDYCKKVQFLYDWWDYYCIPGLIRPWNEGFLTPVFFDKKVLLKYYTDPRCSLILGSDTYGSIYDSKRNHISFGINRNDRVIVWLGDLDELPLKEQHYFRSYNIRSDHDIASDFYISQIEAEWGTLSQEVALFQIKAKFEERCLPEFGFKLYNHKENTDVIMKDVIRPILWTENNIGHIIDCLNRICIESINVKALKLEIKKRKSTIDTKNLKGLKLLEHWISLALGLDGKSVMSPFFVLYDLRIYYSHLVSRDKRSELLAACRKRLGVKKGAKEKQRLYDVLILSLNNSFKELSSATYKPN